MTRLTLDLSGKASHAVSKSVRQRLSAVLGVDADQIVLVASPQDARRAMGAAKATLDQDFSDEGLLALGPLAPDAGNTLIRLGPLEAPVGAVLAKSAEIANDVAAFVSPVPTRLLDAALDGLKPAARLAARADRDARDLRLMDIIAMLESLDFVESVAIEAAGLRLRAKEGLGNQLAGTYAIEGEEIGSEIILRIPDWATAADLADWLGLRNKSRSASVRRTTKETDIALSLNLDGGVVRADTGVHFFDHMLDQIGRHGGIGLEVVCEGDVEVDAHHTIEDVCLAFGEALSKALGDKRGIARFGFETPMDETRASVWIDLSGRPYCRFDGKIPGERVGDFPIEMCEHAFRSIAESLKAAIHVQVEGENAHHMVESCFKSFGRALRMASTIEGDALPSTKGVL